jgi:hypothetical protein
MPASSPSNLSTVDAKMSASTPKNLSTVDATMPASSPNNLSTVDGIVSSVCVVVHLITVLLFLVFVL